MSNPKALRKIDFLTLFDHPHLGLDDECYYFLEYPRGGISANKGNTVVSFIMNFKKSVLRRGLADFKYKVNAIGEVARQFNTNMPAALGPWNSFTLIPIPPSKRRDHPEYDDRMLQCLNRVCAMNAGAQVLDLFQNKKNLQPSHSAPVRPSKQDIKGNLEINAADIPLLRGTIILFDDVLTNGTHFRACKELLLEINSTLRVIGIFIARTPS